MSSSSSSSEGADGGASRSSNSLVAFASERQRLLLLQGHQQAFPVPWRVWGLLLCIWQLCCVELRCSHVQQHAVGVAGVCTGSFLQQNGPVQPGAGFSAWAVSAVAS